MLAGGHLVSDQSLSGVQVADVYNEVYSMVVHHGMSKFNRY